MASEKLPTFFWQPKEDITAYELALCMGALVASVQRYSSGALVVGVIERLPEIARRHFELQK